MWLERGRQAECEGIEGVDFSTKDKKRLKFIGIKGIILLNKRS